MNNLARPPRALHVAVVIVLGSVAAYKRRLGLDPPGLFFDDVWVAVSSLKGRWFEVVDHGLTAGGFTLAVRPLLHQWGDVGGQLLPFLLGCATPAVLYLVLVERRLHWAVAASAGVLLAASPMHAKQSFAIKQYTFDALLAVLVLWLAWRLVEEGHRRRDWLALLGLTVGGVVVSSQTAVVSGVAVAVAAVACLRSPADRDDGRFLVATAGAAAAACGAWYLLVVRPNLSEGLGDYWVLSYIHVDLGWDRFTSSLRAVYTGLVGGLVRVDHVLFRLAVLAAAGFVAVRRGLVGVLLVGPLVVAAGLAAAHAAPLGGGRTDLVYYPSLLMVLAVATDALVERLSRDRTSWWSPAAAVPIALSVAVLAATPAPRYLAEEQRPLIEELEAVRSPGERVLVLGLGQYAYGYYSDVPVRIVEDDVLQTGFDVAVDDPDVVVVPDMYCCADELPGAVEEAIEGRDVVWLVGPPFTGVHLVRSVLQAAGFERAAIEERPVALLERWERT